ncbi:MAG: hypothetical protein NPIRA02_11760 [Nitrospirales bacterium]|nr:MAG: hypothetical protein NPIRA02_11760 [Nitrospirales bacterium]
MHVLSSRISSFFSNVVQGMVRYVDVTETTRSSCNDVERILHHARSRQPVLAKGEDGYLFLDIEKTNGAGVIDLLSGGALSECVMLSVHLNCFPVPMIFVPLYEAV